MVRGLTTRERPCSREVGRARSFGEAIAAAFIVSVFDPVEDAIEGDDCVPTVGRDPGTGLELCPFATKYSGPEAGGYAEYG